MPTAPPRLCLHPGCRSLATTGALCPVHTAARDAQQQARLDAWQRKHDSERPSSHARGYDGRWRKVRSAHLAAHPWCADCGEPATEVHHILPLADGGNHDQENLMSLCHDCHSRLTLASARGGIAAPRRKSGRGDG